MQGLKWFKLTMWLGILTNLTFTFEAWFAPKLLVRTLGSGQEEHFTGPWLGNVGLLLLFTAILFIPAARKPRENLLYAKLAVATRFMAAIYWFIVLAKSTDLPSSFNIIPFSDLGLGILQALTLYLGLKKEGS